MRHAAGLHNGLHVRKIQIDDTRLTDQIGNALNALTEHIVGKVKRALEARSLRADLKQALIRNDDQRIHALLEFIDAGFGLAHACLTFESKRFRHDCDRQDSHVARNFGHNRRRARARAAAHTGGDEHEIRALERAGDLLSAFLRGLFANFRRCARAETLGQLLADLDHGRRAAGAKRLHIGVHRDEVNPGHAAVHHAIQRVSAAAAASDDLDGSCRAFVHFNFKHRKSPFCFA